MRQPPLSKQLILIYGIVLTKDSAMQTLKNKLLSLNMVMVAATVAVFIFCLPGVAFAAGCDTGGKPPTVDKNGKAVAGVTANSADINNCLKGNKIFEDLNNIINFLGAGVGIVATGAIIVGGIQYAAAGGNPNSVTAAKKRITDALIALLAFLFLYAFLQWIVPGGVFSTS
jgi:hypothetical protein